MSDQTMPPLPKMSCAKPDCGKIVGTFSCIEHESDAAEMIMSMNGGIPHLCDDTVRTGEMLAEATFNGS